MYRIIFSLVLFLLIPDVYLYLVHVARNTRNKLWRFAYWLPTLMIAAGYIFFICQSGENVLSHHAQAIGRLAMATLLLAVPKIVFMLCSLTGVVVHALIRRIPRTAFTLLGLLAGTICFGGILYGSLAGIRRFEVKEVDYRSGRLPHGFDGYRILQISDIHIGSWAGDTASVRRLTDLINRQEADLIVFTGDLVNQRSIELEGFQSILAQLRAPDGVYSILGNHDYGSYYRWKTLQEERENLATLLERQKQMGWKLLNNDHAILHHNGDSIALIGVENDGEPPFSQYADLPRAMKGTEGMFRLLLSHNPTHWRREVLPDTDIDLMLAGHTHAMQLELFGRSPAALKYPEWAGMYHDGKQSLYVNVGIGYVGLPFRFGAWPEITVLTLHE